MITTLGSEPLPLLKKEKKKLQRLKKYKAQVKKEDSKMLAYSKCIRLVLLQGAEV